MLEILLVIWLCKSLGNKLRAKGRRPFWMQFILVVVWFVGEFTGGFVAGVVHVLRNGQDAPMGFGIYFVAIAGAALGAGFIFLVAHLLPGNEPQVAADAFGERKSSRQLDPDNPYAP